MSMCNYHFNCHQVAQIIYFIKHIHLQNHTIACILLLSTVYDFTTMYFLNVAIVAALFYIFNKYFFYRHDLLLENVMITIYLFWKFLNIITYSV